MPTIRVLAAAILAACLPAAAFAQPTFTWGPSSQYDNLGSAPAIASITEVGYGVRELPAVEVHQGATPNTLYYRAAEIYPQNYALSFGPDYEFDANANAPSVAVNSNLQVVEVHQGGTNAGTLWYRVGIVSGFTIAWGAPQQYDVGYNPAISMSGTTVLEVHNASNTRSPMLYKIGTVSGSTITWSASTQYDALGWKPSVSITACAQQFPCLGLEVHNGLYSAGPLWYHTATINSPTSVTWSGSTQYDTGYNPRVQIALGSFGFEVHDGTDSPGPLWYHQISYSNGVPSFGAPAQYDASDWNPAIAYITTIPVEVHTANGNPGALYDREAAN